MPGRSLLMWVRVYAWIYREMDASSLLLVWEQWEKLSLWEIQGVNGAFTIKTLYELPSSCDEQSVDALQTNTHNKSGCCCQQPYRRPDCACARLVTAALRATEDTEVRGLASVTDVHPQTALHVRVFEPTRAQPTFPLEGEAILGWNRYKLL
jgi:hypothetical protein